MKPRNFVHKHAWKFNKAQTHRDRKKDSKRGYQKHKNPRNGGFLFCRGMLFCRPPFTNKGTI